MSSGSMMPTLVAVKLHSLSSLLRLDVFEFGHHSVEPIIDTVEISLIRFQFKRRVDLIEALDHEFEQSGEFVLAHISSNYIAALTFCE
jgi:hypothetical protein